MPLLLLSQAPIWPLVHFSAQRNPLPEAIKSSRESALLTCEDLEANKEPPKNKRFLGSSPNASRPTNSSSSSHGAKGRGSDLLTCGNVESNPGPKLTRHPLNAPSNQQHITVAIEVDANDELGSQVDRALNQAALAMRPHPQVPPLSSGALDLPNTNMPPEAQVPVHK